MRASRYPAKSVANTKAYQSAGQHPNSTVIVVIVARSHAAETGPANPLHAWASLVKGLF